MQEVLGDNGRRCEVQSSKCITQPAMTLSCRVDRPEQFRYGLSGCPCANHAPAGFDIDAGCIWHGAGRRCDVQLSRRLTLCPAEPTDLSSLDVACPDAHVPIMPLLDATLMPAAFASSADMAAGKIMAPSELKAF